MMEAAADERVLTISRVIATSPERLFDAWTKPDLILQWWGPEGAGIPEHRMDVKVGGAWRTAFDNPDGNRYVCSGTYEVLERPHRLAFTWAWQQPDGQRGHETVVEVNFEKVARGTRMTLVQKTFQVQEQAIRHNAGWSSSFEKLVRLFGEA